MVVHDFDTFADLSNKAGFSKVKVIEIKDIEDKGLQKYFKQKSRQYWLETEIWCATR